MVDMHSKKGCLNERIYDLGTPFLFAEIPILTVYTVSHRLGQNSILSRGKTVVISMHFREEKQRLEVVRGAHCINQ